MKLSEIKEIFESELGAAKERLEAVGLTVVSSLECEKNELEGGESEVTSLLASLEISAPGITEEDLLYLCLSEDPGENGEFDEAATDADVESFRADVELLAARAAATEDKAEAVRAICHEIDRRIDEQYQAELDRMNAAVKKNLKIAIGAAVALLAVALVCLLIKGLG